MKNSWKVLIPLFILNFLLVFILTPTSAKADEINNKLNFVLADSVSGKILSPEDSISMRPGGQVSLEAHVIFSDGTYIPVTSDLYIMFPAEWLSSNPQVVTVHSGELKGVSEGTAVITANYKGQSASVKVRVSPVVALVASLREGTDGDAKIEEENVLVLEEGIAAGMALTAVLADGTHNNDVTYLADWQSENQDIAKVGKFRRPGLGCDIVGLTEGTTVVTASFNGVSTSIKVEVIPRKETEASQNTDSTQSVIKSPGTVIKLNNDNLESAVRQRLNKPIGDITDTDMAGLTELAFFATGDLSGLEYATNLRKLNLTCDLHVGDISPLAKLTNLEELEINQSPDISDSSVLKEFMVNQWATISNLSALANLTNLRRLALYKVQSSDISPFANLINLRELTIDSDRVSDVSMLGNLKNLRILNLYGSRISDISALAGLTNLQTLGINNTRVKNISPLANVTSLSHLYLYGNRIKDISALANLKNLEYLELGNNEISNITALSGLKKLIYLRLNGNQISDIAPLVVNSQSGVLIHVGLRGNNTVNLENSQAMADISKLFQSGVEVKYDPQGSFDYNVNVYVNNNLMDFPDQKPFIETYLQRTYVPVRFISEALGAQVVWEEAEQKVLITSGNKRVTLLIGSRDVEVNSAEISLDAPAILVNARAMVPLRFVSEALEAEVKWSPEEHGSRVDIKQKPLESHD